jgi:hypothetical protein
MTTFVLDTSGVVDRGQLTWPNRKHIVEWSDLDPFTQGYIKALFFTSCAHGVTKECEHAVTENGLEFVDQDSDWVIAEGAFPEDYGFSDLAPEALASILADCRAFLATMGPPNRTDIPETMHAVIGHCIAVGDVGNKNRYPQDQRPLNDDAQAGHDFWLTRHGAGFWERT